MKHQGIALWAFPPADRGGVFAFATPETTKLIAGLFVALRNYLPAL